MDALDVLAGQEYELVIVAACAQPLGDAGGWELQVVTKGNCGDQARLPMESVLKTQPVVPYPALPAGRPALVCEGTHIPANFQVAGYGEFQESFKIVLVLMERDL